MFIGLISLCLVLGLKELTAFKGDVAIFAIASAKDKMSIMEWIDYHHIIGYDHIYLLDTTEDLSFGDLHLSRGGLVTVLKSPSRPVFDQFQVFSNLPRNETLCTFLSINEYVFLPEYSNVHDFINEIGTIGLTVMPTYNLIANSSVYFPDIMLRRASLRSFSPVSVRYSAVLSEILSFGTDLKPYVKNKQQYINNAGLSNALVYRVDLLSSTEYRWYVEWLCADHPRRWKHAVGPHDPKDYSPLCAAYANLRSPHGNAPQFESSGSDWTKLVSDQYKAIRRTYILKGLVEDFTLWRVVEKNMSPYEPFRGTELYPMYAEETLYADLFLNEEQSDPEMILGKFAYTPRQGGEVATTMTVYGDRDVPRQFVHFCVNHLISDCEQFVNYALPTYQTELSTNPTFLAGTNVRNSIDYTYLKALLHYYQWNLRRKRSALSAQQSKTHAIALEQHPEECYRGWRNDERMLRDYVSDRAIGVPEPRLPSFVMYVLHHDNASLQLVNDALFEGDPVANSNGLIVPVAVRSSVFFEYIAYRDVFPERYLKQWSGLDYVGITTYKTVVQYSTLCTYEVERVLRVAAEKRYDVIPMVRSSSELLQSSVMQHRRSFRAAWDAVLLAMNYNISTIRKYDRVKLFYRSSMLIKPEWLKRLSQFMTRAMQTILMDNSLYALCSVDARYETQREDVTRRIFDSATYKLFPFLMERLPTFYFAVEGASVCHNNVDCPSDSFW